MRTKVTGYLTEKRGLYYVVLNYPSEEKGKRKRKTLSTGLKTERNSKKAAALFHEMIQKANEGIEVHGVNERTSRKATATEDGAPYPEMLFSDYMLFWLEFNRSSWEEVTYVAYARVIRSQIAPYFLQRKTRLNEINMMDIQMFYNYELNTRKISGSTVCHFHANIRKALADAVALKLIDHNPAADVKRPKKDNYVSSYYNAEELTEMFPLFYGTRLELPVMLAAYYGLRRSEVVGLKWSAINFEEKTITISHTFERVHVDGKVIDVSKNRTKNESSFRTLPLTPDIEEALLRARARQEENRKLCGRKYCKTYRDYICVDDLGNLVAPNYITQKFKEILLRNDMRPIRFHDLRHSCASLLIKNKIPMKQVQLWLGHSSFATTANIYAHLDIESKQDAADMIASTLTLPGGKKKAATKTTKKAATKKTSTRKKQVRQNFS